MECKELVSPLNPWIRLYELLIAYGTNILYGTVPSNVEI